MLIIRLSRVGKRKQPSYRILVQEKQKDPWGAFIENIGHYNPLVDPEKLVVKKDRLEYWMQKGADISDTLNNLFINEGLIKGEKRRIVKAKKAEAQEAPQPQANPEQKAEPAVSA